MNSQKTSPVGWLLVFLCIIAAGLSVWLTVEKMTGQIDSLAGCGKGSGCENVLGSKWSVVFGTIPVSLFSSLLYLAVAASLLFRIRFGERLRIVAAFMMIAAAVWFTALQLLILNTICPYCMAMHSLGVVIAFLVLFIEAKKGGRISNYIWGSIIGIASVIGLAVTQYFGPAPDTHRLDKDVVISNGVENDVTNPHTQGEGRLVTFFGGDKSYRVSGLPHLGSVDAEHVIVKYFDYTCASCKAVHKNLEAIQEDYPKKLSIIVLPVPLNRSCNPHLPLGVKDHENACDFARLSLRVWLAEPEKFGEFHEWLFEYHQQPMEVAEAMAYSLVGEDKMGSVSNSQIEALLRQNVRDYEDLVKKTPVMPKLILKDSIVLQGVPQDVATLKALLIEHLQIEKD
ncbi:MAG: vitamin K epoxide reductase family protein [Akkermansiaceae bacterium]